jgi:hypothetical protein
MIATVLDRKFRAVSVTEREVWLTDDGDCNFADGCTWAVRTVAEAAATGIMFTGVKVWDI